MRKEQQKEGGGRGAAGGGRRKDRKNDSSNNSPNSNSNKRTFDTNTLYAYASYILGITKQISRDLLPSREALSGLQGAPYRDLEGILQGGRNRRRKGTS